LEYDLNDDMDEDLEFDSDDDVDKESEFDLEKDDAVETTKQHMTLTLELAQEMIDDMCTACGPPPTLDSGIKALPFFLSHYVLLAPPIMAQLTICSPRTSPRKH
jgi:hypothetical protein